MSILQIPRRGMMGATSSSVTVQEQTVTLVSDATSSNRYTATFNPVTDNSWVLMVWADEMPVAQENYYGAIAYASLRFYIPCRTAASSPEVQTQILRPNGTIGTDASMAGFNPSTGTVSLGGSYGRFYAGATYHIKILSWNN